MAAASGRAAGQESALAFDTEAAARQYVASGAVPWQPLSFECTVDVYNGLDGKIQAHCKMYQPALVTYQPRLGHGLASRLEAVLGRPASAAMVEETAWVLGVWLTDGAASDPVVSQIGLDRNRPEPQPHAGDRRTRAMVPRRDW